MIEKEDVLPLLEEISSFAQGRIAAAALHPEHPMGIKTLAALTEDALELGILPTAQTPGGIGLWENQDSGHAMAFNIGLLRRVAQVDVSLAFAWHRQALAHQVSREFGLHLPQLSYLHPVGHYGLARTSLARWLTGETLSEAETSQLSDWLDRQMHATPVVLPEDWQSVVWLVWHSGAMHWQILDRAGATVLPCAPQHGLDELRFFKLSDLRQVPPRSAAPRAAVARILKMDMVGLLAIGAGGLARGENQARDYVSIRKQGGKLIARHPSVHQMVSEITAIQQGAEAALTACELPIEEIELSLVASLRSSQHTALCRAANLAMQVHGGIGYMRDLGVEKVVRDMNMLRLQTGGVLDIPSFITGLNGGFE